MSDPIVACVAPNLNSSSRAVEYRDGEFWFTDVSGGNLLTDNGNIGHPVNMDSTSNTNKAGLFTYYPGPRFDQILKFRWDLDHAGSPSDSIRWRSVGVNSNRTNVNLLNLIQITRKQLEDAGCSGIVDIVIRARRSNHNFTTNPVTWSVYFNGALQPTSSYTTSASNDTSNYPILNMSSTRVKLSSIFLIIHRSEEETPIGMSPATLNMALNGVFKQVKVEPKTFLPTADNDLQLTPTQFTERFTTDKSSTSMFESDLAVRPGMKFLGIRSETQQSFNRRSPKAGTCKVKPMLAEGYYLSAASLPEGTGQNSYSLSLQPVNLQVELPKSDSELRSYSNPDFDNPEPLKYIGVGEEIIQL